MWSASCDCSNGGNKGTRENPEYQANNSLRLGAASLDKDQRQRSTFGMWSDWEICDPSFRRLLRAVSKPIFATNYSLESSQVSTRSIRFTPFCASPISRFQHVVVLFLKISIPYNRELIYFSYYVRRNVRRLWSKFLIVGVCVWERERKNKFKMCVYVINRMSLCCWKENVCRQPWNSQSVKQEKRSSGSRKVERIF